MNKIIEKALEDLAGMQLNLESDVARSWVAQRVETALAAREQESDNTIAEVAHLSRNTTMGVDDVIVTAMEHEGYTKGDSGYCFRSGKRDVQFHAPNGDTYEVVFRQLNNDWSICMDTRVDACPDVAIWNFPRKKIKCWLLGTYEKNGNPRKKYNTNQSDMRCWLPVGVADRYVGIYTKVRSIMKDYVDMGICLVVYLVAVVAVGGAIGLFLDWI